MSNQKSAQEKVPTSEGSSGAEMDPIMRTVRVDRYNTWIMEFAVTAFEGLHSEFEAQPGDVLLASVVKSGTTWMKALLHSIMACVHSLPNLLDKHTPHDLVPHLELFPTNRRVPVSTPRLLATHLPLHALPRSITDKEDEDGGKLKIVYVTRNPRDTFVSLWKFRERMAELAAKPGLPKDATKQDVFDSYCAGHFHGGPFAENVLSYLQESRVRPQKVLFITYEELQADCESVICKIGDFLGYPSDVVRSNASAISQRCSFGSLSNLDFNKKAESEDEHKPPNAIFFRTGKSGEWMQHFDPAMEERIAFDIERKLEGEGFSFDYGVKSI